MMKRMLFLLLSVLVLSVAVYADGPEPGMYYVSAGGLQPVESETGATLTGSTGFGIGGGSVDIITDRTIIFSDSTTDMVTGTMPEFLFVYDMQAKKVLVNGNVFRCKMTIDPKLAVLVQLEVRKNKRRLTPEVQTVGTLTIDSVGEGQYRVSPSVPLEEGEYAFLFYVPAGFGYTRPQYDRVWTFSVRDEEE